MAQTAVAVHKVVRVVEIPSDVDKQIIELAERSGKPISDIIAETLRERFPTPE